MLAVFSDEARLQRMLDVEAALARAQAKLDLIPAAAAREITAKAQVSRFDLAEIGRGTELVGYPVVPLVKALGQACAGDAGRWVHWGATTQEHAEKASRRRRRRATHRLRHRGQPARPRPCDACTSFVVVGELPTLPVSAEPRTRNASRP